MSMTVDEALEVLGYLLGHEKAVDSGEMEDVQNCLNSQEQEALKVILSEFRELKEKATAKNPTFIPSTPMCLYFKDVCPNCKEKLSYLFKNNYCPNCGQRLQWGYSEGKE